MHTLCDYRAVLRARIVIISVLLLAVVGVARADWPMVRGDAAHSGFFTNVVGRTWELKWAVEFKNERIGTALEPIVVGASVFIATHDGSLYSLDAATGAARWRFAADGVFLNAPALTGSNVCVASEDGFVYALRVADGELVWRAFAGEGGCSAAPTISGGKIFLGTRSGDFLCIAASTGQELWRQHVGVPIRQTASAWKECIYVTGEDLKLRAYNAATGTPLWTTRALAGQTARDYFPVIVSSRGRTFVLVRTNPTLNMAQRIQRDRALLCRQAGVDDSSWRTLDAWIEGGQRGTRELWKSEQHAITSYLATNLDAQTLFVVDAANGAVLPPPPVLWAAGCQGVGAPPAVTADGRVLVYYRSVYGNWNHGVAPLVALGLLDVASNSITPLFHNSGVKPQWNQFWGTADETQSFVLSGEHVLIDHQGTVSAFHLKSGDLFSVFGQRDSYGGLRAPPWARNEWHGPARAGLALADNKIFWQSGSRILCLAPKQNGTTAKPVVTPIDSGDVRTTRAAAIPLRPHQDIERALAADIEQVLGTNWAPLYVEPGLAGRDFSFDRSDTLFIGFCRAYHWLPRELRLRVRERLLSEWRHSAPFSAAGEYELALGAAREWPEVPLAYRQRAGMDRTPHRFGSVYAAWQFGETCDERPLVDESWPEVKKAFEEWTATKWRLDPNKGDLYANRYLASLLACASWAERVGDRATASNASWQARLAADALVAWWKRAATNATMRSFDSSAQLDAFIGKGDALSFAVAPHRHKLALFSDMTPELASILRTNAGSSVAAVWNDFARLYRTWHVVGEERQVHSGENFIDPPDLALNGYRVLAWLRDGSPKELCRRLDLPFCRADLFHIEKLALALDALSKAR